MIVHYFKTTLRSLTKNRVFATINIIGLTLGMAVFILIFQYVNFEKSVNTFHANLPNLYRILLESPTEGKNVTFEFVSPTLGPLAKGQFAEVDEYCRIFRQGGIVSSGETETSRQKVFREDNAFYADASFFTMFSFPVSEGKPNSLDQPNTVALSTRYAEKYFADENPVNKVVTLENQFGKTLYRVVAVFNDMPENSDIKTDLVFSLQTLSNPGNLNGNQWAALDNIDGQFLQTFTLCKPRIDYRQLEARISSAKKTIRPMSEDIVRLQPLKNLHLANSLSDYYATIGNLKFLYVLEGIGFLILAIAWFNYINLSTAGALKRAKEVGVRKVVGANRNQLAVQFLGESAFLNVIALIMALLIVGLVQGLYNNLIGKDLSLLVYRENFGWLGAVLVLMIGAFASGAYSAMVLSSFNPAQTLKGVFTKSLKGIFIRKGLVVFQFGISVFLIASTIILYRQIEYMRNGDLGIKLDQLVILTEPVIGQDSTFAGRSQGFLNELKQQSFVKNFSMSGTVPGNWYNYSTPGYISLHPNPGDEKIIYAVTFIDERYLALYGIEIKAGQNFSEADCNRKGTANGKIMVNSIAALKFGFASPEDAIGQKITTEDRKRQLEIIGVVSDYHHLTLRQSIDPVIFYPAHNPHFYSVKISSGHLKSNLDDLQRIYKKYFPGNPVEFSFADESYNRQFQSEEQSAIVFFMACGLSISIACLGLLGLSIFTVGQRKKEIGIRKVLGASVNQITRLLSKDFVVLVLLGIAIAVPLAWFSMHQWLQEFAYHVAIHWWIFGIAGSISVLIAVVTICTQAIQAASGNPVDALRSE